MNYLIRYLNSTLDFENTILVIVNVDAIHEQIWMN
jgi:hypothetical protein